ncbi:MAG: hypothetical protein Q8O53_01880 [Candidatus Moranbacteria bacterium]|nr:hypothetical protein [Candidatus Moranbacteria bacterium]
MALDQAQLREELIAAFHLDQVPEEKRDELLEKMTEALLKHIFLETMDKIGEDGVKEYEALLERQATPEEMDTFFETKIPGYNVFIRQVAEQFKEEMTKAI